MKGALVFVSAVALGLSVVSCSDKGWSVKGSVENAPEGAKIAVEGFNAGNWYNIDSVEVKPDGSFAFVSPEGSPYPDVYRVSLDGKSIYFPIDSLDAVVIKADGANFDTDFSVEGSPVAVSMMEVDKRIAQAVKQNGAAAVLADSLLKRDLGMIINEDESGVLGYYIVNKTVGGTPLFSTTNRADVRIIGALANKFKTRFPDDPRTQYLCARYLQARSAINPADSGKAIEAQVTGLLDFELYDAKGTKRKLSDVANNFGITLLSFTSYQIDPSVPYNVELNRLYEMFRPQNLAIYQVSIDSDEVQWRTSATNLPWTAVWYDAKDGGALLNMYNVAVVPLTYIIKNGDLVDRIEDPSQLEAAIRKNL